MLMLRAADLPAFFECDYRDPEKDEYVKGPILPIEYRSSRSYDSIDLPTEMVVCKPGYYAPLQGRAWSIDLVYYCGLYIPSEVAETRPMYRELDANGCWSLRRAIVIEVWEDHGDDDHTRYEHVGFAIVSREQYDLFRERASNGKRYYETAPTVDMIEDLRKP